MNKKWTAVIVLAMILLSLNVWANFAQITSKVKNLGAGFLDRSKETIMGSSLYFISVPNSGVNANATTTNASLVADAGTIDQLVNTSGIRKVILDIEAIGGTATSSLFITQLGSHDGTNYFNIASSTDVLQDKTGTTTISMIPKAFSFDPGTASTTLSVPFLIDGYKYTRFVIWGDNLSTDPDDGIKAWITAYLIEDIVR